MCGAVFASAVGATASATTSVATSATALVVASDDETDTVSSSCSGIGVVGSALITEQTATATTSHMGSAGEGTVKVNCKNVYRDVSVGSNETVSAAKTGTSSVTKIFTVHDEDFMKTLDTTHYVAVRTATWSDKTSVKYVKRRS